MATIERISERGGGGCRGVCLGETHVTALVAGAELEFRVIRGPLDGGWHVQAFGAQHDLPVTGGPFADRQDALDAIRALPD